MFGPNAFKDGIGLNKHQLSPLWSNVIVSLGAFGVDQWRRLNGAKNLENMNKETHYGYLHVYRLITVSQPISAPTYR